MTLQEKLEKMLQETIAKRQEHRNTMDSLVRNNFIKTGDEVKYYCEVTAAIVYSTVIGELKRLLSEEN